MTTAEWKAVVNSDGFYDKVRPLYVDETKLEAQRARYLHALDEFEKLFGDGPVELFSAPGRSEVGGNHTDHQRGKVLACSLNLDVIAVVRKRVDGVITVQSEGYPIDQVDLKDLNPVPREEGTSKALIRGVAGALAEAGYTVGGFEALDHSGFPLSMIIQGRKNG